MELAGASAVDDHHGLAERTEHSAGGDGAELRILREEMEHGWHRGHRDRSTDPNQGQTNKFTLRSWGLINKMKHKGRPEELHKQSQVK